MSTNRRAFLGHAAGAALFGVMPLTLTPTAAAAATPTSSDEWDVTWANRLTGKHKAVFDCPEVDCVDLIKTKDGVSAEEARKRAIAFMVPGVILQPSGVFAAVKAQEAGCSYVRAS